LGLVKVPDTFGAFGRLNHINFRAHGDGGVGAFGLADIAIDALVGDDQSHGAILEKT
jgi:hypothetical protein